MKKNNFRILFVVFVMLISTKLVLVSCAKDQAPPEPVVVPIVLTAECPDTVSYQEKIKPLIDQNCATSGCHDAGGNSAGYILTTHTNVAAHADIILKAMREDGAVLMPMGNQLPDSLIQTFSCWKDQGKLNN